MLENKRLDHYTDLIRLEPQRLRELILEVEQLSLAADHPGERRKTYRHRCMDYPFALGLLQHPGGSVTHCKLKPRNIAQGGIALIHGAYVHPNTRCAILVRFGGGSNTLVRGHAVHCRHLSAHVHEFGLRFDEILDLGVAGIGTSDGERPGNSTPSSRAQEPLDVNDPALADLMHDIRELLRLLKAAGTRGDVSATLERMVAHAQRAGLFDDLKRRSK